ncbi:hypothetical protein [Sphingobium yanoikuyae]|jgi:hypothetical protein|uniref:hypothetical protein n=1 Tax=Sphingobium yanoikuyae TaxID=13690 RepID=UPI0004E31D5D|nr:hypothetical protein [Sphingobium yanoikuyae]KFD30090.1 hypothetical protein IH86_01595 [Sphingobium yanoikuyae]MDV3477883.1 hypothetical protein [Sphingobium yanoikuyae]
MTDPRTFELLRLALSGLDPSASATATGADRPLPSHIFAPEQHIGALDPDTTIVLGARGVGKSFWAGVLLQDDTRVVASKAFPNINFDRMRVTPGYTGQSGDGSVSQETIDARVPEGQEQRLGSLLWRCILLRAAHLALDPESEPERVGSLMERYADPEEWEDAMLTADRRLREHDQVAVVIFDALDGLALDWARLRDLTDALLQVAWSVRGYRSIRAKLFLRQDQMEELGLRFIELPKMLAGAATLRWTKTNLYGMLFARLALSDAATRSAFNDLLQNADLPSAPSDLQSVRRWSLSNSRVAQLRAFELLAGAYMGRTNKKGRTYDWPVNHLADGHDEVTPRSFLVLIGAAARFEPAPHSQAINAEGIKSGLQEASKVRLDQLATEYKWIKRVIAPLARLQVPCSEAMIVERWAETETVQAVMEGAAARRFLPPIQSIDDGDPDRKLILKLLSMGVLSQRQDGRFDMPDLFRVAAKLLRKGGVTPA